MEPNKDNSGESGVFGKMYEELKGYMPKKGYRVMGIDDFEDFGEQLFPVGDVIEDIGEATRMVRAKGEGYFVLGPEGPVDVGEGESEQKE